MQIKRNIIIGERVRFYRTSRNMSLDKLSKAIANPITGQQLARYETGQSRWPADLLVEIAITLGLDIRLLTGLEDGKHEGKETAEWDAERYKCKIMRLPEKARAIVYKIIDGISHL